jgi:hypothetical protein
MLRFVLWEHERNTTGNLFWLFIRFKFIYKLVSWVPIIFQVKPCRSSCEYFASSCLSDLGSTPRQVMLALYPSEQTEWDLLRLLICPLPNHTSWNASHSLIIISSALCCIDCDCTNHTSRNASHSLIIISSTPCCIDWINHTSWNASYLLIIISSTFIRGVIW